MSIVQRILYHEEIDVFEDDLGNLYTSIEDVVAKNELYFDKHDTTYLINEWKQQIPKRINMSEHSLTWEYDI